MKPLRAGDPQEIGEYRIVGRLGSGGMGQVFLGRSRGGREVAVKVVHRHLLDLDPTFRARFRREMEVAKRVGGFWTAGVVDSDADADSPWYASEYIDARNLQDVVRSGGPLSEERTLALGAGLAEALVAVHRHGILHRDLKPANVLVTLKGPRVIDFGVARVDLNDEVSLTATGQAVGTVGYVSPEQLEGRPATVASDVFALGALLVFASTGRSPFPGATPPAVIVSTMKGVPDLKGVPPRLQGLVRQCLAPNPADRPTVAALLAKWAAYPGAPSATSSSRSVQQAALPPTRIELPGGRRSAGRIKKAPIGRPPHRSPPASGSPTMSVGRIWVAALILGVVVVGAPVLAFRQPGGLVLDLLPIAVVSVALVAAVWIVKSFELLLQRRGRPGSVTAIVATGISVSFGVRRSLNGLDLPWWGHGAVFLGLIAATVLGLAAVFGVSLLMRRLSAPIGAAWGGMAGVAIAISASLQVTLWQASLIGLGGAIALGPLLTLVLGPRRPA